MAAESKGDDQNNNTDENDKKDDQNGEEDRLDDSADPNKVEERVRVDRKKLELLLQAGLEGETQTGEEFFRRIQEATNTTISWPSKLKIGAKSKKDPHIKVAGLPEDLQRAKQMIMSVLDTKTSRVTLKMDVSFTDHSHIIGRGGNSIKRVMQDTGCHIHFPDSNRTSSEKSNQVSIAGPPLGVEAARKQIRKTSGWTKGGLAFLSFYQDPLRYQLFLSGKAYLKELLPIVLMFEVPTNTLVVPDNTSPAIHGIAQKYNVTITFKQRPRTVGFIGTVRGLHSDPVAVRDAILKVLEHLTGSVPATVPVTTQIEIDPKHHMFMIGLNGTNIKQIMQHTGASIQFPDSNAIQGRKSTVSVTGTIESAITAKVRLMECLPLVLMFDVKEDDNDLVSDTGASQIFSYGIGDTQQLITLQRHQKSLDSQVLVNHLIDRLDVLINVKAKPRQGSKSVIIKSVERNVHNMYLTRIHLLGEDPKTLGLPTPPLATPVIPNSFSAGYLGGSGLGIPYNNNNNSQNGNCHRDYPTNLLSVAMNGHLSSPMSSPLNSKSPSPLPFLKQTTSSPTHSIANYIGNYNIVPNNPNLQRSSTFENEQPQNTNSNSPTNRVIGSEMTHIRRLSMDSLLSPEKQAFEDSQGLKASSSAGQLSGSNEHLRNTSSPGSASSRDSLSKSPLAAEVEIQTMKSGTSFVDVVRMYENGPLIGVLKESMVPIGTCEIPKGNKTIPPPSSQDFSPSLSLTGSWNSPMSRQTIAMLPGARNGPYSCNGAVSPDSGLSDSQSDLNMSGSLSQTSSLIGKLALHNNKSIKAPDYEVKRQMASRAMQNHNVNYGEVRQPTGTWSGYLFSKSMPESALKELWNSEHPSHSTDPREHRPQANKFPLMRNFEHSPSASLNSSASSNASNSSSSSASSGPESPPRRRPLKPPPGLGEQPIMENAALLLNNNIDYNSVLSESSSSSSLGTLALAAITDLADLFNKVGLSKYTEVFHEQEVDLNTFMTLTDEDLKELGVSTFGARKRMILAIKDLQRIHRQRPLISTSKEFSPCMFPPKRLLPGNMPLDLASSSLMW